MSGFFSRLAERAVLAAAPAIAPAVPPLFAAVPAVPDVETPAPAAEEQPTETREISWAVGPRRAPAVAADAVAADASHPAARLDPVTSLDSSSEPSVRMATLRIPSDAELAARIDHLIGGLLPSGPPAQSPAPVPIDAVHEIAHVWRSSYPARDETRGATPIASTPDVSLTREDGQVSRRPPVPVIHREVVLPRQATPPSSAAPMQVPSDSRPVVRITIGRLEVRAISTPASGPTPRPATPKTMGLDEYLARRGGGAR